MPPRWKMLLQPWSWWPRLLYNCTSPEGCTDHGICKYGRCFCQPGYSGLNCTVPINAEAKADAAIAKAKYKVAKACPNQCSHNGFCLEGKCLCQPGYDGVDCSRVIIGTDDCPNDCGGKESPRGLCWLGKCFCFPGFSGADCMESVKLPCLGGCSEHTDNATSENAFVRLVTSGSLRD